MTKLYIMCSMYCKVFTMLIPRRAGKKNVKGIFIFHIKNNHVSWSMTHDSALQMGSHHSLLRRHSTALKRRAGHPRPPHPVPLSDVHDPIVRARPIVRMEPDS